VRDFEPRLALDGGADGLAIVRDIAAQAPGHLKPRAACSRLEIGADQGEAALAILRERGYAEVELARDLGVAIAS